MMHNPHESADNEELTRRSVLGKATGAAALTAALGAPLCAADEQKKNAVRGRVRQSIVFWCFNVAGEKWSAERTCQVAKQLGCASVELLPPTQWNVLKKFGLTCFPV